VCAERTRSGARRSHALASGPPKPRPESPDSHAPESLPPKPRGLSRPPGKPSHTAHFAAVEKNEEQGWPGRALIRWSVQEIRRVAMRLAQRRIHPAHVIAWSRWRRALQAAAQDAYIKRRSQL